MASRFSEQKGDEQNHIQAQFDISRAKSAISDLTDRIKSLNSLGKINDKDSKEILKVLKTIQGTVEKAGKKKKA